MELPNKYVVCPVCGTPLDGATSLEDESLIPKEGDVGICFQCGTILEYEEGYFVHEMTNTVLDSFKLLNPETYDYIINLQYNIKKFKNIL